MASALTAQRCLNHLAREAVARCPQCREFYCRECIAEHEDRVICSACLRRGAAVSAPVSGRWRGVLRPFQILAGVLVAWVFFYFAGRVLLSIPSEFHEGTVWQKGDEEETPAP